LLESGKAKSPQHLQIYQCSEAAHYHIGHYEIPVDPKCPCGHTATSHCMVDAEIVTGCKLCQCSGVREEIFVTHIGKLERGIERLRNKVRELLLATK